MRTSYSALETFKQCPLKYKYSQIDKIREPKRVESVFGTIVHSALKFMFERSPLYPTEYVVINFFTEKWSEKSGAIVWPDENRREREEKMYFEEGVKILKNFYKKNKPWNYNAIELEGSFSVKITDERSGEVHQLTGKIDRIDKNPETDEYEIIDYKTGKRMPPQDSLADNLQLGVYGLALASRWPDMKTTIKTTLYFLKHNESVSVESTGEMREKSKGEILSAIRAVEKSGKEGAFPPIVSPLCNWCGYRKICPMWSHEYLPEEKKSDPTEKELANALQEFFEIKKSDDEHKKRLAELRDIILRYMDSQKVERVFGDHGSLLRTTLPRYSFDLEKVRPILEAIGKWDAILDPDMKKLEKLITTLPHEIQERLLSLREKKETVMLKPGKK